MHCVSDFVVNKHILNQAHLVQERETWARFAGAVFRILEQPT
jgi:hypothetical protein